MGLQIDSIQLVIGRLVVNACAYITLMLMTNHESFTTQDASTNSHSEHISTRTTAALFSIDVI